MTKQTTKTNDITTNTSSKNKININNKDNISTISIDGKTLFNAKIIKSKNLLDKNNSITIEIKDFDLITEN